MLPREAVTPSFKFELPILSLIICSVAYIILRHNQPQVLQLSESY